MAVAMEPSAFLVLAPILLSLMGCSRESMIKESFEGAAHRDLTLLDEDFRLAMCGWKPRDQRFELEALHLAFPSDSPKGRAEVTATLNGGPGFSCAGHVSFYYEFHEGHSRSPAYWELRDFRRLDTAPIVALVEQHATPLALDSTVAMRFTDAWLLPDRSRGLAYRVEIPAAGRYCVKHHGERGGSGLPRDVVYQAGQIMIEGNGFGSRDDWQLAEGPAFLLSTSVDANNTLSFGALR